MKKTESDRITISPTAAAVRPLPARLEEPAGHTPGEWTMAGPCVFAQRNPGGRKTWIADVSGDPGLACQAANARLIAAAPALLEVLKAVKAWLREDESQEGAALISKEALNNRFQDVRAAIALAEGKA
jgi:hypothetical protein